MSSRPSILPPPFTLPPGAIDAAVNSFQTHHPRRANNQPALAACFHSQFLLVPREFMQHAYTYCLSCVFNKPRPFLYNNSLEDATDVSSHCMHRGSPLADAAAVAVTSTPVEAVPCLPLILHVLIDRQSIRLLQPII
jgi:hypothetical protein